MKIIDVIDGDTVKVKLYDNSIVKIRFLMVDTPELRPLPKRQLYATEATNFLKSKIRKGREVTISRDTQLWDCYDRLLAYFFVDDILIQEELLKEGFARTCYLHGKNHDMVKRFKRLEEEAKNAKKRIWSIRGYVLPDRGFNTDSKKKTRRGRRTRRSRKSKSKLHA